MNIGIDARLYGIAHAGIGRYTQSLVRELLDIDKKNSYFIFAPPNSKPDFQKNNVTFIPATIRHYSLKEQLYYHQQLGKYPIDLMHFTHFSFPVLYTKPFVVTIHDLLWHEKIGLKATTLNPAQYLSKYLGYRYVIRQAVTRSRAIFAPSKVVADSIEKTFNLSKNKIVITYEAPDPQFLTKTISKPDIKNPQIIYTGSLYPHKNVNNLILALKNLPKLKLIITSSRNIFMEQTQRLVLDENLTSQVEFKSNIDDTKLIELFQRSIALIQPSLSEGFGLTGLEAMACGTPVICSDLPIFHEVYKKAALFVDTTSPKTIAAAIEDLQDNTSKRQQLIDLGNKQARTYSWAQTARQTLDTYCKFEPNKST